jgi:hypothetical protein
LSNFLDQFGITQGPVEVLDGNMIGTLPRLAHDDVQYSRVLLFAHFTPQLLSHDLHGHVQKDKNLRFSAAPCYGGDHSCDPVSASRPSLVSSA